MCTKHTIQNISTRSSRGAGPTAQRGAALLVVLVMGAIISFAALILSLGAVTELKIARNDLQGRQAMTIAEAGIGRAVVAITPSAADGLGLDEELGNSPTGGLAGFGASTTITEDSGNFVYQCADLGGAAGGRYCVRAYDNFDELSGADAPLDDSDDTIILRSQGTVGDAIRVVDTVVGVSVGPECAILTQGNLQITGNPIVSGSHGCVHTNSNLTISGNPSLAQGGTASGGYVISGNPIMEGITLNTGALQTGYAGDNDYQPPLPVPSVRPMLFGTLAIRLHQHVMNHPAGYRLDADGNIYVGPGFTGVGGAGSAWTCNESPPNCTGGRALLAAERTALGLTTWKINAPMGWIPAAEWEADGVNPVNGVYFVEGNVKLGKDWGTVATPWRTAIISINSVQMPARPRMAPYHQSSVPLGAGYVTNASPVPQWELRNILIVSGNDIEINGDAGGTSFAGGFFAHQQIKVNGNPEIVGFLIAEDGLTTWTGDPAPNCDSLVDRLCDPAGNSVSGNPNITFNGLGTALYPDRIERLAWNNLR